MPYLPLKMKQKKGGKITKRFKNIIMLELEPKSVSFLSKQPTKTTDLWTGRPPS